MQFTRNILKGALAAALILAALSGWGENKGPIYLAHATNVGGTVLVSGNYNLRWEGGGGEVQLKIYQGKKEVAAVPAQVIQLSSPAPFNSAVVESKDGTQSLSEIRFEGKKFALRIAGDAGSGVSAAASKYTCFLLICSRELPNKALSDHITAVREGRRKSLRPFLPFPWLQGSAIVRKCAGT